MEQEPADVTRIRQDIHVRDHRMFAGKLNPPALGVRQRAPLLIFRGTRGPARAARRDGCRRSLVPEQ
jgi:menaquinone-dependent protoporphyrinogen oxidase